jgi:hypothetical protein
MVEMIVGGILGAIFDAILNALPVTKRAQRSFADRVAQRRASRVGNN